MTLVLTFKFIKFCMNNVFFFKLIYAGFQFHGDKFAGITWVQLWPLALISVLAIFYTHAVYILNPFPNFYHYTGISYTHNKNLLQNPSVFPNFPPVTACPCIRSNYSPFSGSCVTPQCENPQRRWSPWESAAALHNICSRQKKKNVETGQMWFVRGRNGRCCSCFRSEASLPSAI